MGINVDITARKAMESQREALLEALRQAEARYRAFLTHSSEAIWRVELQPTVPVDLPPEEQIERLYRHGTVAECNQAAARQIGLGTAEEVVGRSVVELLPRLSAPDLILRAWIEGGYQVDGLEPVEVGAGGDAHYFLNSLAGILDAEGRALVQLWGVTRDITDRRSAEEALRAELKERAVIEERQRLARDLHDLVSQTLFSASLTADVLPRMYARDPEHEQKLLEDLRP